jgi:hypothetical protein
MTMPRHYTDDELVLYHYGELRRDSAVERHLEGCEDCRIVYQSIATAVSLAGRHQVPVRGDQYGLEVWQRIRSRLGEPDTAWWMMDWLGPDRAAFVLAAATLVMAVAAGGAWFLQVVQPPAIVEPKPGPGTRIPSLEVDVRRQTLLASVADHLEQSQRVLTDVMNAPNGGNITTDQTWAEDLLIRNRLYRQRALDEDEVAVADVLDGLERGLLEIVHSPSRMNNGALDLLRRHIDESALVFKMRVTSEGLRQRALLSTPPGLLFPQPGMRVS